MNALTDNKKINKKIKLVILQLSDRTLGSGTDNTNQLSNAPQEAAIVIKHLIYQPLK